MEINWTYLRDKIYILVKHEYHEKIVLLQILLFI